MKRTAALLAAVIALASCDGNPFGGGGGGGGGGDGGGTITPGGLQISQRLLGDLGQGSDARYIRGASPDQDRLEINIMFAGNPQTVTWERLSDLDVRDSNNNVVYRAFVR